MQVGEDTEHLARDVAELRCAERPPPDPRGQRLALDEFGREIEAQLHALALGEAGDEPGNARVMQRLERRSFALEGVDLHSSRNLGELKLLESDDLAIGRLGAIHAPVGTLRKHAIDEVTAGVAGHTAKRATAFVTATAAPGTSRVQVPPKNRRRSRSGLDLTGTNPTRKRGYRASGDRRKPTRGCPWKRGRSARPVCMARMRQS